MTVNSNTQTLDLEKSPVDQVIQHLHVDPQQGLTDAEAKTRLAQYGLNGIHEQEPSFWAKLCKRFTGPIAYMIEAAALVSALIHHWEDFTIIMTLLLFNVFIELWQDHKASSALAALKKGLALNATVKRNGQFHTIAAENLVPGDIVQIQLGQIVPADLRLISGEYVSIDQAALTGESLPVNKAVGDEAYSGSVVKQGEMEAVVIATGEHTFFGRTAKLVAGAGNVSHPQKAMFAVGNALIIGAVILAVILVVSKVYFAWVGHHTLNVHWALTILEFILVLLVASIPVAMPAVFSITMALGALELSKQKAIVAQLSAIEEMAGVDILCSDKTGTLTQNQLTLGDPVLFGASDMQSLLLMAALASNIDNPDAIDHTILNGLHQQDLQSNYTIKKFTPFDPISKRASAIIEHQNTTFIVTKGAPQIIANLCQLSPEQNAQVTQTITDFASKGFRALSVAISHDGGKTYELLGILSMFDPPRKDSKATIELVRQKGIQVKMITGDDTAIAIETAKSLGLGTNILTASEVFPPDFNPDQIPPDLAQLIEQADGFARVLPEHKYAIVKALQHSGHIVAMTGDGVNDAPALKQADCGTAVQGATDAARSAAHLILTAPGLSVINTAIDAARQIFARIMSYTIYRIALTMSIMMLVVFSAVALDFTPLTAVMIVIISLLDDIPIMAIAYDHTEIAPRPMHWNMKKLIPLSNIIGLFSVLQSILFLWFGYHIITSHHSSFLPGIHTLGDVQTMVFLQVVIGGHLLLFITRSEKWFFQPPFPAAILFWAIICTQILAICMCGFGWLVRPIPWSIIAAIYLYDVIWMFILNLVRIISNHFIQARHSPPKSISPLQPSY